MFLFKHDEIIDRLRKYPLFDKFSFLSLKRLLDSSEIIEYPSGAILFQIHDPSDYVYYIIDGYVELFSSNKLDQEIASVRTGNLLGETSVLAGEPHSFTARTNKSSQLLKMKKDIFLKFFEEDSRILMLLTQNVAKRLRRMLMGFATDRYPFKHIVLYNTSAEASLNMFKQFFQNEAVQDNIHVYDYDDFIKSKLEPLPFLFQCENQTGVSIYLLKEGDDRWNKTILFHAEYVYLMASENQWANLPIHLIDDGMSRPCDIVIYHEKAAPYENTNEFYNRYPFKRHHHFQNEKKSYQRLYRYMTGQAIGLVISAGGFRGYAHYGLIKALLESDIPIDCIAGCSFGAAIGAALAENFNWDDFKSIYQNSIGRFRGKKKWSFHFTLPITSLLSCQLPTEILQEVYLNRRIEDIPINFFCVTSNLSARQKELKTSGKIWEWLRASISIPGVFPPFEKEGNIYVDGAVSTSLPIPDMRDYLNGKGTVISFDVRSPLSRKDKRLFSFPPILSFKDMLLYKLGFSKKKWVLPNILDVLLESSCVESHHYDNEGIKQSDLVIAADTSSLSFSDPSVGDPESLIAYALAKEKLKEYHKLFERWI